MISCRGGSHLVEADFVVQQLQVLLQLQVVLLEEAVKRLLHVSELSQEPATSIQTWHQTNLSAGG